MPTLRHCPPSTQEEEDLALAQALSASEAEYQQLQRQVSGAILGSPLLKPSRFCFQGGLEPCPCPLQAGGRRRSCLPHPCSFPSPSQAHGSKPSNCSMS